MFLKLFFILREIKCNHYSCNYLFVSLLAVDYSVIGVIGRQTLVSSNICIEAFLCLSLIILEHASTFLFNKISQKQFNFDIALTQIQYKGGFHDLSFPR